MTDLTLTVRIEQRPGGPSVLTVDGELDQHSASRLREAMDTVPVETGVVLELSGLTYCDSTGMSVLVSANERARADNGAFALVGLDADLMHHFRIVGLDGLFTFYSTVDDAVRAAGS